MRENLSFYEEIRVPDNFTVERSFLYFNNFDIISAVYGSAAAEAALLDAVDVLNDALGACGFVEKVYRQSLQITVWDMSAIPRGMDLCSYLLLQIAFRSYGDAEARFRFSITALDGGLNAFPRRPTLSIPVTMPENPEENARYINRMIDVDSILSAIDAGRLMILLEPISRPCDGQAAPDYEIDARIALDGGVLRRIAFWRSLFEELGLIQILDYHIATAAAAELRADENMRAMLYVSPSCLRADTWGKMIGQIVGSPDSAGRLVIGASPGAC